MMQVGVAGTEPCFYQFSHQRASAVGNDVPSRAQGGGSGRLRQSAAAYGGGTTSGEVVSQSNPSALIAKCRTTMLASVHTSARLPFFSWKRQTALDGRERVMSSSPDVCRLMHVDVETREDAMCMWCQCLLLCSSKPTVEHAPCLLRTPA